MEPVSLKNARREYLKKYVMENKEKLAKSRKEYYLANKERLLALRKARYAKNPKKHLAINLKWKLNNLEQYKKISRKKRLKTQYNLTEEQVQDMITRQDGRCAICNEKTKLHIDHNHKTGKVRELLCARHNQGLGMFQENIDYLKAAILYIEKHNEKT